MKFKILAITFISIILVSCGEPNPQVISNGIPRPFDRIWKAVMETLHDLQYPILFMDKDSGLIKTEWISFQGKTNKNGPCVCERLGGNIRKKNRHGRLDVFIDKTSENTTNVGVMWTFEHFYQFEDGKWGRLKRNCASNGTLEAKFFKLIKSKTGV